MSAQILEDERRNVSFKLDELAKILYWNNADKLAAVKAAYELLNTDPDLKNDPDFHNWSREKQMKFASKMAVTIENKFSLSNRETVGLSV